MDLVPGGHCKISGCCNRFGCDCLTTQGLVTDKAFYSQGFYFGAGSVFGYGTG